MNREKAVELLLAHALKLEGIVTDLDAIEENLEERLNNAESELDYFRDFVSELATLLDMDPDTEIFDLLNKVEELMHAEQGRAVPSQNLDYGSRTVNGYPTSLYDTSCCADDCCRCRVDDAFSEDIEW